MAYKQQNNPFISPIQQSNKRTKGKGRHFRTDEEGAGMTEAGVKSYRSQNPGSKLKTAVTEKNPTGRRAARRRSFCARFRGMKGPMKKPNGKPTRKARALSRWNC